MPMSELLAALLEMDQKLIGALTDVNHAWPELRFGWRIVAATLLVAIGASLGSVGGLGGGGIFVPVLVLIVGFDAKSAPAVSKCMIMAQTLSTVAYNVRLRRTSTGGPLVDYDLAVLFQPMLLLGISVGVLCNVMFPDWLITLLLIVLSTSELISCLSNNYRLAFISNELLLDQLSLQELAGGGLRPGNKKL